MPFVYTIVTRSKKHSRIRRYGGNRLRRRAFYTLIRQPDEILSKVGRIRMAQYNRLVQAFEKTQEGKGAISRYNELLKGSKALETLENAIRSDIPLGGFVSKEMTQALEKVLESKQAFLDFAKTQPHISPYVLAEIEHNVVRTQTILNHLKEKA